MTYELYINHKSVILNVLYSGFLFGGNMLTIVYGDVDGAITDPDTYFNHTYSQKWFEDPFVKEIRSAVITCD